MRAAALLLVVVLLAGCAGGAAQHTPEHVRETGVLRIALANVNHWPYFYWDENGQPQGIEPEIARNLAQALGAQAQFVPFVPQSVAEAVDAGAADIGFAGFARGALRERQLIETAGHWTRRPFVLTRRGESLPNESILSGRVVYAQPGQVFHFAEGADLEEAVAMLLDGSADAFIADEFAAHAAVAQSGEQLMAELFDSTQEHVLVAVMSRRNGALFAFVDEELTRILQDGLVLELAGKY